MKNLFKITLVIFAVTLVVSSCKKKEETDIPPVLTNISAENHDGGDTIARGGTISVDFDAEAKGDSKLDYYHIEIHDHPASGLISDEYRIIDESFMNSPTFSGLKNAHVHEHITVPDSANLGNYHVVITVVDNNGNSVDTENGNTGIYISE